MGSSWCHHGFILESLWNHNGFVLGVIMDSLWSHHGFILASSWMESLWIHLGIEARNRGLESRQGIEARAQDLDKNFQILPRTRNHAKTSGDAEVLFLGDFSPEIGPKN